jgi:hypothetical protein
VPDRNTDAVIPAGRVIELDVQSAEARTLVVEGTLRAARGAASTLTMYGNLIVRRGGVLDYGRPNDRVTAAATLRFVLDESRYVGGATMTPVSSDVGLWAIDDAQVWIHGVYRDTWSPLVQTAAAGATTIRVDPNYAQGWRVGDLLLFTPTNARTAADNRQEDEVRRIVEVQGPGQFRLDAALQYAHTVTQVTWTDAWGDTWTEVLAGKVANLTSNIRFTAADPNHRPHIIFMNRAKHYVEDLAVEHFSPVPRIPLMGRYAWHNHLQDDGSRGSYLRRVRLFNGPGDGLHIHESWGINVEDLVVYNQARSRNRGSGAVAAAPIMLERTEPNRYPTRQRHAADDCWIDRPLVVKWGMPNDVYFTHGIWTTGSMNCSIVGAVAVGANGSQRSSGMLWEEGGSGGDQGEEAIHVYRAEAFSNWRIGFHSWQNATPNERIVDLLSWRNGDGVAWGAYGTNYWGYQVRALENLVQLSHWAVGWGITGFLADGMGRANAVGIEVRRYAFSSSEDGVYEDGVVRNVSVNLRHIQEPDAPNNNVSWVQFARVAWDAARAILFDGGTVAPPGSRFRIRQQRNLPRASNFTLYKLGDPNAPAAAVLDSQYNALRVDNDTAGTRPQPPRVRLSAPADDVVANGRVRLTAESNASHVDFYLAHWFLERIPVSNGQATLEFDVSTHPYRRAYFYAVATGPGGASAASRVIRVRRW